MSRIVCSAKMLGLLVCNSQSSRLQMKQSIAEELARLALS